MSTEFVITDAGQSKSKHPRERTTCTVRALATAAKIPYDTAHEIMKMAGRPLNGRAYMESGLESSKLEYEVVYDNGWSGPAPPSVPDGNRIEVADLAENFPHGRYIVRVLGHVFALINGKAFDVEYGDPNEVVAKVWKINLRRKSK